MHKLLPIDFSSEATATGEFDKAWSIKSGSIEGTCDIPLQFGGGGGGFSPEDLFLQSLINCFVGTFKVYAKASHIHFTDLAVKGVLTVDQDQHHKTMMKSAFLNITVVGADRPDRVETIVAKTLRDGFILSSVKTEIRHKLEVLPKSADNAL